MLSEDAHLPATPAPLPPEPGGPIIFFDGVCGLCDRFVDFVIARDRKGVYRFAPLQGETYAAHFGSQGLRGSQGPPSTDAPSTVLLAEGPVLKARSDATLRILAGLGGPWRLAGLLLLIPRTLRDGVYDFVAARRYRWFGKKESCRLPTPEERGRFLP